MDRMIPAWPFAVALLIGMLICLEIGRQMGTRWLAKDTEGAMSGLGVVEGAMFTLYSLMLAFTFSEANSRFDLRRELIVEEANAIGTAYLRLDLLPAESQPALREQFREYIDSRLETYRKLPDIAAAMAELSKSEKLQKDIWVQAVAVTRASDSHPDAAKMLLPALNTMFDITVTRTQAARIHPALVIYALLFLLSLVCSVLAGYGMAVNKRRNWLHTTAFAVLTAASVFVILNIEYPRMGLIRIRAYDQVLVDLRQSMQLPE
jgi:hypothetical protein